MMMITSATTNKDKEKKETAFKEIEKPSSAATSRHWSSAGFRNPRIVRVSRTFGGKDRHSKVCTVRGLRDRRIRLSVPTAVQLYDLQDRLGLAQPSKVIDWLIDNAMPDIDKLPPLHFPPHHHLDHHHHPINKSNGHDFEPPFASLYHAPPPDNNLQLGALPPNIINNIDHPTAAIFAPSPYNYQYCTGDQTVGSSRMIVNNMTSTTSSTHVLQNYSLMSSLLLHNNNSNSSSANELIAPYNNNSSLAKSFPAIFNNPRLLSSQASLFGNRLEKDNG